MRTSNHLILTLAAAAALTACGGSSSPETVESVATPLATKGVMIDGYVSGATVFCDSNGNGVLDTAEAQTTTDSTGAYTLAAGCTAAVVGRGGINVDTGFPFNGVLKAPAGSTVITPLTTLLVGTGLTVAQLADLLGQPVGTDVTKIDVANGQHPDLFKKTLAVQQMLDSITRVSTNKSGGDAQAAYARIAVDFAKGLATQTAGTRIIAANGDVNTGMLTSIVKSLPDVTSLGIVTADIEAAVVTLAAEAQQFSKATGTDLAALAKSLQDPVRPPLDVTPTTSYLSLAGDSVEINGTARDMAGFTGGVSLDTLDSIGFKFAVVGTPPKAAVSVVALELTGRDGDKRKLQLMITEVAIALDASNQLSITVPASAKVLAYAHKGTGPQASGTEVNLTISDLTFLPIKVVNNGFTLNYKNIVNKVTASADVSGRTTAEGFLAIKGSFDVKLVVSGLNVRKLDGTAYASETVSITNTTQKLTGPAFSGVLNLQ